MHTMYVGSCVTQDTWSSACFQSAVGGVLWGSEVTHEFQSCRGGELQARRCSGIHHADSSSALPQLCSCRGLRAWSHGQCGLSELCSLETLGGASAGWPTGQVSHVLKSSRGGTRAVGPHLGGTGGGGEQFQLENLNTMW